MSGKFQLCFPKCKPIVCERQPPWRVGQWPSHENREKKTGKKLKVGTVLLRINYNWLLPHFRLVTCSNINILIHPMNSTLCFSSFLSFLGFVWKRQRRPNNQTNISCCILCWLRHSNAAMQESNFFYKNLNPIPISPTFVNPKKEWQSQIEFMKWWWWFVFSLLWPTACLKQGSLHWHWITMPKPVPMCCKLWGKKWSVQCFLNHVMQLLLSDYTFTTALFRFISSFNSPFLFWYFSLLYWNVLFLYSSACI